MLSQQVLPSQDHQSLIYRFDPWRWCLAILPDFPNGFPQWIDISKLLRGDIFRQTGLARCHHNGRLRGVATILPGAFTRVILKGAEGSLRKDGKNGKKKMGKQKSEDIKHMSDFCYFLKKNLPAKIKMKKKPSVRIQALLLRTLTQ